MIAMEDKDVARRDRVALESALCEAGAKKGGTGWCCPFHEDRHPSMSVHCDEAGVWRATCHTATCAFSGDVFDVRARVAGKRPEDLLREYRKAFHADPKPQPKLYPNLKNLKESGPGQLEACYVYAHPKTKAAEMVVLRHRDGDGRKSFVQAKPVPGGFVKQAPPKPWPLYNRARVAAAKQVFVVEGEKCVHALHDVGFVATTSPGGAGKASLADWSLLAGREVYLWPDADPPDPKTGRRAGVEHMRDVSQILERLDPPPRLHWIEPEVLGLPEKGDAADYLQLYGGDSLASQRESVETLFSIATSLGASTDLSDLLEQTISGKRRAIPWPWPILGRLSKALLPGTVTSVCGDPGCGKSFLLLESAVYWHREDVRVAIYELEEDAAFWKLRALSQLENQSELMDDEWVQAHAEETRAAFTRNREFLDAFGRCLYVAPDEQVKLDDLLLWVRQRAEEGCRVIVIDPITAAETTDKPWVEDLRFLMAAKAIVRRHGASLILATHPRKGKKTNGGSLDDLAGGAAYPRFSQTVFWVHRHDQPKEARLLRSTPFGTDEFNSTVNRGIRLGKTRNGRGAGREIGYNFDGKSLRFAEQGVVVKYYTQKESTFHAEEA